MYWKFAFQYVRSYKIVLNDMMLLVGSLRCHESFHSFIRKLRHGSSSSNSNATFSLFQSFSNVRKSAKVIALTSKSLLVDESHVSYLHVG